MLAKTSRTGPRHNSSGPPSVTVYVQASKGMTRVEYERAVEFMTSIGVQCLTLDDLAFGGVIGIVLVVDVVERDPSRWFHGPFALALADPRPEPFAAWPTRTSSTSGTGVTCG